MALTWDGDVASNGWRIAEPQIGPACLVVTPAGQLSACPCCGAVFVSRRAARAFVERVDQHGLQGQIERFVVGAGL